MEPSWKKIMIESDTDSTLFKEFLFRAAAVLQWFNDQDYHLSKDSSLRLNDD